MQNMTKILNGKTLADIIKKKQAGKVRRLMQRYKIQPRLAIVTTSRPKHENPPIETYARMKQRYGTEIGVIVEVFRGPQNKLPELIGKLNTDDSIQGIIVQLPLENPDGTDEIVGVVAPAKDVDALGSHTRFNPATPMAINMLLAGYDVNLKSKKIVLVGNGRLVGRPLAKMWRDAGLDVAVLDIEDFRDRQTFDAKLLSADVIVTATGVPNLITSDMIKTGAVVVDAGTASEQGKIVGDVTAEVRERQDVTITPEKGGVGPLTIAALMENVIEAAQSKSIGGKHEK